MDIENARRLVQHNLSTKRFEHTVRVAETAKILAECFSVSVSDAYLAGLLHDYAKEMPRETLKHYIEELQLPKHLMQYHHELWHAPVGAMLLKREYPNLSDDVVLAIYYHTTGRRDMTELEKVIFLADYIEPGRSFPGVEEVRDLANENLNCAVQRALRNTIIFLATKDAQIYPDTLFAYNDFTTIKESDSIHGNKRTASSCRGSM